MIRQSRRRPMQALPEISLTPLIDTALVLLVIFMVATPMMHNALDIKLPKTQSNDAGVGQVTDQDITVGIDAVGRLSVDDIPVADEAFVSVLEQKLALVSGKRVFVKADESLTYKTVISIVDRVKCITGVEHVVLPTERA